MTLDPIVVLDIGTRRIRALVAEENPDGHSPGLLAVTGYAEKESRGIRTGSCTNADDAAAIVSEVISDAAAAASVRAGAVHLPLTGLDIDSLPAHEELVVNGVVVPEHLDEIMGLVRKKAPPDAALLHNVVRQYSIDDMAGVMPVGNSCSTLKIDTLLIHGPKSRMLNLVHLLKTLDIEIAAPFFAGLCAATAALTPEKKLGGVLLLDLGAGTTDFVAYANAQMADAGVLPVGGDILTNDIAAAFHLNPTAAEILKCEHGQATLDTAARNQRVPASSGPGVKLLDLQTVINCRMAETFSLIRDRLRRKGILSSLRNGVVLSGGGANLPKVVDLAGEIFDLPCSIAEPALPGMGPDDKVPPPQMATIYGAATLAYAELSEAAANRKTVWRSFKNFFGFNS